MSLKISVRNPETDETIDMNWLRNQYGLCNWAEDTYAYTTKQTVPENQTLWYAINHWNYAKSPEVDRQVFLDTVNKYGRVLLTLDKAYYWFDVSAYIQFVQPQYEVFPKHRLFTGDERIEGTVTYDRKLGIPMEHFNHRCFYLGDATLDRYKEWYGELVRFAEMLQVPGTTFDCSN